MFQRATFALVTAWSVGAGQYAAKGACGCWERPDRGFKVAKALVAEIHFAGMFEVVGGEPIFVVAHAPENARRGGEDVVLRGEVAPALSTRVGVWGHGSFERSGREVKRMDLTVRRIFIASPLTVLLHMVEHLTRIPALA